MSRADDLRAELEVLALEEEAVAAKAQNNFDRDLKLRLREARQRFREIRAGSAAASPDAIKTATPVAKSGS